MSDQPSVLSRGAKAPDFALPSSTGQTIRLSDFAGKQPVVLYFYPRADTPGCTKEACGFRDALPRFQNINAVILGISPDPPEDVRKFAEKFNLNFPLLADADHAVADAYGAWQQKNSYGQLRWGVARTTFIIDKAGKIAEVFEKVKPDGHEQAVLDWFKDRQ